MRIRLQTQPHAPTPAQRLYAGPVACARTLVARAGVAHGLYRGAGVTAVREAQAYGVWFLTYEWLMARDVARRGAGATRRDVEAWRLALYGGLAGEALWLASYPFDVVKSRMQTDGLDLAAKPAGDQRPGAVAAGAEQADRRFGVRRYASTRDCFAQTWRAEGLAGFWRGLAPTLLRAMPVSAATFFV